MIALEIFFKNFFYCVKKAFRSQDIQFLVIFPLPFNNFQIQMDKWKWNDLRCHEWAGINLQMQFLEQLKNCFILHHQTWTDNIYIIKEFF